MEEQSIHHLSLFLDTPIYVLPEEKAQYLSAGQVAAAADQIPMEDDSAAEIAEEIQELAYEGNFEKGVLVAFDSMELSGELKELLFKILDAVGCSLKDIALCNEETINTASPAQVDALNPTKVIVFGRVNHPLMHHKKENYQVEMLEDTAYLYADSLDQINTSKELKKALWGALKTLFNVTK